MNDANYLRQVREQYENYPYPLVDPQHEYKGLVIPLTEELARINQYGFEGKKDFRRGFRALVAGGGTGDAAIALAEQLRETDAEIVYVDISTASMAIAQERARLRGLTNIIWRHDSLLNVPSMGIGTFDYINSSGVLHHLADPDAGLAALKAVLKDDGVLGIMVYAKYGRTAVYYMQETLRLLNRGEANLQTQVDNTRALMQNMPNSNWFLKSPPDIINETASDIGLFDLLLHPQDRAYSVPELYEFIEKQGLQLLQLWPENLAMGLNYYNPAMYLRDEGLRARAAALPLRDQQALAELLNGHVIRHMVYAAPTPRAVPQPEDLDLIPMMHQVLHDQREATLQTMRDASDMIMIIQQSTGVRLMLPKMPYMDAILGRIDNKSSTRDIFRAIMKQEAHKKDAPTYQSLSFEFAAMYRAMHNYSWLWLRAPNTMAPSFQDTFQARMPPRV